MLSPPSYCFACDTFPGTSTPQMFVLQCKCAPVISRPNLLAHGTSLSFRYRRAMYLQRSMSVYLLSPMKQEFSYIRPANLSFAISPHANGAY